MEELLQAYRDYMEFLSKEYAIVYSIADTHGYKCELPVINNGNALRERIAELEELKSKSERV